MGVLMDIDLGGILVAPFVRYLFLALIILIAVRFVVGRLGLRSMFANPPLAEAALYVCTPASLMAFWVCVIAGLFRIVANSDLLRCNILIFNMKSVSWRDATLTFHNAD